MSHAAPTDFEFIIGDGDALHRRREARLSGCTAWPFSADAGATREGSWTIDVVRRGG